MVSSNTRTVFDGHKKNLLLHPSQLIIHNNLALDTMQVYKPRKNNSLYLKYRDHSHVCDSTGHAVALMVSHRPLNSEAQAQTQASPCGICGVQSATGTSFFLSTSNFSPVSIISYIIIHSSVSVRHKNTHYIITCQLFKDPLHHIQTFVHIVQSASMDAEQTSIPVFVNRCKLKWYIKI